MSFPRLSPEGERVFSVASQKSTEFGHRYLGVEHVFLGLAEVDVLRLSRAFSSVNADLDTFVSALCRSLESTGSPQPADAIGEIQLTPRCREILSIADQAVARAGDPAVAPEHLAEAIFLEGRSLPLRMLFGLEIDVRALRASFEQTAATPTATTTPMLDRFGRDLTAMARRGQLSPVIGRADEMDLVAQVLLRKNKNNPVLIGEPGVGKTAVVEGFAQRLLAPTCPEPLQGRRIIELSLGSLVAGTKFRGEFEERMLEIVKEVAANPEVILFLDEIHGLVGAGATGGGDSLDAANIFKPALARGELRCVGATTITEYRRYVEQDPALERRFEKILVEEPSEAEAFEILTRLRPSLEEHHELSIQPDALRAAVDLTVKHVFDRRLPDKALDAVDQSCARKRLRRYAEGAAAGSVEVRAEDIAKTVSQWTGIPLERISGEAAKSLLSLESDLQQRVIGQDEAVRAVSRTILTAKAGLSDPSRPLGVFFFAGPTGVGKTHLAKSLAEVLFGDGRRLVRIDMSEYMEPHSVSNLIGAPPGYVGHEREGVLIAALRTHPHCIVLFDEVEKAHPKVFDIFLQIFDDGRLTGTQGKTADFTQSVVILTSNIDPTPVASRSLGFGESDSVPEDAPEPRAVLLEHLRPELVNRIDEVVAFNKLGEPALRRIIDLCLEEIEERLAERSLRLELEPAVYDHLIAIGDTETFGARELRRLVDKLIRQPLATRVLEGGGDAGVIRVSLADGKLEFRATADTSTIA